MAARKGSDSSAKPGVDRRRFLGASVAGAAAAVPGSLALGAAPAAAQDAPAAGGVPAPTPEGLARDAGPATPPAPPARAAVRPGSDVMVELLRQLGVEYIASNPGSSFEGLQESIINHGDPPNVMPEFITALHEESAVDMAHGYAKATGKPMAALLHGTLGVQHAAMAIYQAFHNQVPILILVGRDDGFIQEHTADDMASMVRAFTKWDAQPRTLTAALLDIQQAWHQAQTAPCGPSLVVLDTELQKEEAPDLQIPIFTPPHQPTIGEARAKEIAQSLVAAQNPRIEVGRLRTHAGVAAAVELAELVGASTSTRAAQGPMSFPQRHPLCGPGEGEPDYVLGLEAPGETCAIMGPHVRTVARERDVTGIGFGNIREGRVREGGFGAPYEMREFDVAADAEASLPFLIAEARALIDESKRQAIDGRKSSHAEANKKARVDSLTAALEQKRRGWNSSPVSLARIYAELWPLIKDENWILASPANFTGNHHADLWDNDKPWSYLGAQGAGGIGIGLGSSVGAGLAARSRGQIVINIQADGDINFVPGSLWTAAHHRVPMLTVMHNNRAWHQEFMFIEYMAGVRGRGTDRAEIGTTLRDPHIDYAKMAEAYGVESEGPIEDPEELAAAFARGLAVVKEGRPYLIDVICQPR
jgi:thiamine pyrophosphate-dependent acetolactate synthase large subunit-like protein